ncbi:hypothetical protein ABIE67_009429 [Streptomyces sp. V4I8]
MHAPDRDQDLRWTRPASDLAALTPAAGAYSVGTVIVSGASDTRRVRRVVWTHPQVRVFAGLIHNAKSPHRPARATGGSWTGFPVRTTHLIGR